MKIAVVVNEINIRGGTHKQVLRLCQYLAKEHIPFELYTKYFDLQKTYPEFAQFKINYLSKNVRTRNACGKNILKKVKNLKEAIEEEYTLLKIISKDCNIINVHDNGLSWLIYFAKKRKNVKVVWQVNDLLPCFRVGVAEGEQDSLANKRRRFIQKYLTSKVDAITVNVTKNQKRVKQCYHKDAKVLYCGVDQNGSLKQHHFQDNTKIFRILSSGVFFEYRNYETLVQVIEKLADSDINVHLDIIGSTELCPDYANKIKNMILEKGLSEYITIWGQVDEHTYNELHDNADIFAFINVNQSWGLAVFEAMSCGLPTIVSDSVGAIELLHNEVDSIIIDPFDVSAISNKILRLRSDREYYQRISDNAYNATKNFTWDEMYSSKLVAVFEKVEEAK